MPHHLRVLCACALCVFACCEHRYGQNAAETAASCTGVCEAGYWCPAGSTSMRERACPGGTWGMAGSTNTSCSGTCAQGHYCPLASTSSRRFPCSSPAFYCAEASASPALVPAGHYSVPLSTAEGADALPVTVFATVAPCVAGEFCARGVRSFCPPGRYGTAALESSPSCFGLCAAGRFGSTGGHTTPACEGPCAPGAYCPEGSTSAHQEVCPAGRWGAGGSVDATCDGLCLPGYYCSVGSVTARGSACDSPAFHCPEGSDSPTFTEPGLYSTQFEDGDRVCEDGVYCVTAPCEPGSYCQAGVAAACPAGRYGSSTQLGDAACDGACPAGRFGAGTGQTSPLCDGECSAGSWCPPGSVSPTERTCGAGLWGDAGAGSAACGGTCPAGFYCPPGTASDSFQPCGGSGFFCGGGNAAPVAVATGFYSSGGDNASVRTTQSPCGVGSYCLNGVSSLCPAGRYGASPALSSPSCSGLCDPGFYGATPGAVPSTCDGPCDAGFYCPAGSTSANARPCPGGRWGNSTAAGGSASAECSGSCEVGHCRCLFVAVWLCGCVAVSESAFPYHYGAFSVLLWHDSSRLGTFAPLHQPRPLHSLAVPRSVCVSFHPILGSRPGSLTLWCLFTYTNRRSSARQDRGLLRRCQPATIPRLKMRVPAIASGRSCALSVPIASEVCECCVPVDGTWRHVRARACVCVCGCVCVWLRVAVAACGCVCPCSGFITSSPVQLRSHAWPQLVLVYWTMCGGLLRCE